jgi:hypothetical protein
MFVYFLFFAKIDFFILFLFFYVVQFCGSIVPVIVIERISWDDRA